MATDTKDNGMYFQDGHLHERSTKGPSGGYSQWPFDLTLACLPSEGEFKMAHLMDISLLMAI
jgi:hypothetical protein